MTEMTFSPDYPHSSLFVNENETGIVHFLVRFSIQEAFYTKRNFKYFKIFESVPKWTVHIVDDSAKVDGHEDRGDRGPGSKSLSAISGEMRNEEIYTNICNATQDVFGRCVGRLTITDVPAFWILGFAEGFSNFVVRFLF